MNSQTKTPSRGELFHFTLEYLQTEEPRVVDADEVIERAYDVYSKCDRVHSITLDAWIVYYRHKELIPSGLGEL